MEPGNSFMSRLLLVEDEPGLVMTLTDRLMAEGYDVESATDAPSGLEMAASGSFDAILLDVMLPGGNGMDVCRTLRQRGLQTPIRTDSGGGTHDFVAWLAADRARGANARTPAGSPAIELQTAAYTRSR